MTTKELLDRVWKFTTSQLDMTPTEAVALLWTGLVVLLPLWWAIRFWAMSDIPLVTTRRIRVSETPTDGQYVRITGRESGPVAFLLTLIHCATVYDFLVTDTYVRLTKKSLRWEVTDTIPIHNVSSSRLRQDRSFLYFLMSTLFAAAAGGLFFAPFLTRATNNTLQIPDPNPFAPPPPLVAPDVVINLLIVAVICRVLYEFSKRVSVECETSGGRAIGIACQYGWLGYFYYNINAIMCADQIINRLAACERRGKSATPGGREV
ncbi:MAG TPA: hypothetical protein VJY33_15760 [Isosphaeraceae bacterium]|nr:hypothetical protein [Isosphaeraceae bacterium]